MFLDAYQYMSMKSVTNQELSTHASVNNGSDFNIRRIFSRHKGFYFSKGVSH